ncbi:hypothetical protein NH514_19415 [Pseudoalteromonas sp. ACER1]|nr:MULTISPECIES: hypothetical protein [Pseudoalteromonas]MDC3192325.1 hypothetical protein [Pseudoalteromonas elyakovii]MCC9662773.1 hypothetical protein [Pseudoalteromonas sp. MB41]MCF2850037.1 hypothetical protein [Pseudoalteromonas sp. PAST1]MCF2918469.1 hypothetical protein [Pseudoalteromonas sp. Cn5-37]MCO7208696.1 hypothetical protein [Pseudoalteromonas sp. CnMc7-37]
MNNKSIGAYLRRRERKLIKRAKRNRSNKLAIRASRLYQESNRVFHG